jgi:2-oxoisovalerate dehydrogenase E1 component beta subunit
VICPATPEDAKGLLVSAIEDPNPCLYFEHKHLYRRIKSEVPDERYTTPLGKARVHKEGTDVSVITWGAMVYTAEEAAKQLESEDGVSVEILDLRTLVPWDKQAVLESVQKTSKVLVLHEDTHTGGFGGEIAATIAEEAFERLDAPIKRITAPDTPVPFSPQLEKAFIPQVEDVLAGLKDLAEY